MGIFESLMCICTFMTGAWEAFVLTDFDAQSSASYAPSN